MRDEGVQGAAAQVVKNTMKLKKQLSNTNQPRLRRLAHALEG